MVGPGQAQNRTALQQVGVFLPQFYSTPRGRVMAYGFHSIFRRIYMLCGLFVMVKRLWTEYMSSRTTEVEHGVLELSKSGQNGK